MTDDQYIDRIRKYHARRKVIGVVGIVISLIVAVASYLGHQALQNSVDERLEARMFLAEGRLVEKSDISNIESLLDISHALGVRNGSLLAQSLTGAGVLCVFCIFYVFGGRKERLLLRYYDQATSNQ
ncbi:hypothetical protein [Marinobacter maritimus]|uniref:hypothetical protein n=1 Tax=Marinobacter maritimus TaxID=277961 RepID=UPI0011A15535|nr:hypothetical protein [Marinobacter maritimus]